MIFPPSPRHGIRRVFGTRGLPNLRHGSDGDLATDPTTGKVYAKSAAGWAFKGQGFNRLFGGGPVGGYSDGIGDPFYYEDLYPYTLSASQNGNIVTLTWTHPWDAAPVVANPTAINNPPGQRPNARLFLQRSTSQFTNILTPAFVATVQTGTLGVLINGSPPVDANWTNVTSWLPGVDFPYTYQDTISDDFHIHNYRLIQFYNAAGEGVENLIEIDWNIATVTRHYAVTVTQDIQGAHISWV